MHIEELATLVADAMENPDTWCTGDPAQDAHGNPCSSNAPDAVRWCALGHACRISVERGFSMTVHTDPLLDRYRLRFGSNLYDDNDKKGREYTRDRLRELAQETADA